MKLLIIDNDYPNENNLYGDVFVHVRVKKYKQYFDCLIVSMQAQKDFVYEGIQVKSCKTTKDLNHEIIQYKPDVVLIHFILKIFIEKIIPYHKLPFIIWVHGYEALGWYRRLFNYSWKNFFSRSFFSMVKTNMLQLRSLRKLIHKSNSGENIQFVFVSKWMKKICELDTFTKVKKASIIPNPIDVKIFNYNPKNLEQRKRILMIRPFHTKKYATDIAIAAIIKLSALPFFKDLHFTIIGKGKMYDKQIKPIKHFSNIVFINRFLTQQEIKMYHDEHGVFLCPTRQDAQGVSMCEAMSSGLIPITSNNTAIPEFVTNNISGFLTLNSAGICDRISFLYNNANSFFKMSENSSANIQSICSIESVITKELDIICKSAKK